MEIDRCLPWHNDVESSETLSSYRVGLSGREKWNMDKIIYEICFLFCTSLTIGRCQIDGPNPIYAIPSFFICGIVMCDIITTYVYTLNILEARGDNLRRSISERAEARRIRSVHEQYSQRMRQHGYIEHPLSELGRSRYVDPNEQKRKIQSIEGIIDDIKGDIPNGQYLDLMNKLKEVYENL